MKKIFFAMVLALVLSIQNFCAAAVTIEATHLNGNDKIRYPVVHMADSAIEKKINDTIRNEVELFINGTYRSAENIGAEVGGIVINYDVGSNQAGNTVILSILMTESRYYKNAAHPATFLQALNFNTGSGALMDISYLTDIGSGVKQEEILQRLERALVKHCKREGIQLFGDALPLKKLPETFYWDKNNHVHFVFQQYDIAPYAAGIIDVDIDE